MSRPGEERLGATSASTPWRWVPLASGLVALLLVVLPTYGLTQVASTLTLVPTAWAFRKVTPPRPRVLWVGVAVNVLALLGATWLFVDFYVNYFRG